MIALNDRSYRVPARPTVVICADGCDPAYLEAGLEAGVLPTVARWRETGFYALADAVMPTFTNPNNLSIVTGAPPALHGISGNFALDRDSGAEIMMTDPEMVRGETILALMSQAGVPTAAITAKDKLRRMLGRGLDFAHGGICFSSEQAERCTLAEHGIDGVEALVGRTAPDMYSADLSLFVLDAGIRLVEEGRAQLLYLSLSDYVQHGHAPDEPEALQFHQALDDRLARLEALGCIVALTADHGMNDKSNPDGSPRVIWLQDLLDARFGKGSSTVICPITDRFVAHHGALGGFVRVYCHGSLDPADVIALARKLPGIEAVHDKATAVRLFDLPADREGDVVVISRVDTCIGASEADHDLSGLKGHRLRSHGGISEAKVPFILSHPLRPEYAARASAGPLESHQIFDFAINGVDIH